MRSTWWVLHILELFLNHVSVHMGPGKPCLLGIVFISWREILFRSLMEVNGLMLPKVVLHLWVFEWILSVSIQITITEHNFQVWFWQQFTILRKASEKSCLFFFNFNYFVQLEYPMVLQVLGIWSFMRCALIEILQALSMWYTDFVVHYTQRYQSWVVTNSSRLMYSLNWIEFNHELWSSFYE